MTKWEEGAPRLVYSFVANFRASFYYVVMTALLCLSPLDLNVWCSVLDAGSRTSTEHQHPAPNTG